jgi:hypothetical protein
LNYEYKPKLDRNSMRIAEKLMPAKERLLVKKKRSKSKDSGNLNISYLNASRSFPNTPSRSPTRSPSRSPTNRTIELYSHGLENMKKREIMHSQKKVNDGNEYKNYAYKPVINSNSPVSSGRIPAKSKDPLQNNEAEKAQFYQKTVHWKKNVDGRKEKMRIYQQGEMGNICTFKPQICRDMMPNDEKFIVKRLSQIEDYVNKRRGVIQKKKDEEVYLKKKFVSGENYKGKMTIPKEFNLKTDIRGRNKSKEGGPCRDHHEHRSLSPSHVNLMRQKLKTDEFFVNNINDFADADVDNEVIYYDTGNNRYGHQHEQVNTYQQPYYNSRSQNYPPEQQYLGHDEKNMHVFMNAINNLHDQLVNFKI